MTFPDLDEAFRELSRRADEACEPVDPHKFAQPDPRNRSHVSGTLWNYLSVAAVVAIAVGIGIVAAPRGGSRQVAGTTNTSTPSISAPVRTSSPAKAATPSPVPATDVPKTQAALIARFRSILGDTATFTVDSALSTDNLITGVLTSNSGTRGMYVLELDKNVGVCGMISRAGEPPTPRPCPNLKALPDGSALKVDPNFPDGPPNGVMNDAIVSRADGWQISLYTSNVQGKYYGAPLLGKNPALTVEEVTGVVTSGQWLAK
ncbi:hypothetical protein SAMN05444157_1681 [Frankineae bacterium MT45]|nr:hypothetical protein SAMN05444157_1681 [Frankineae bacterium MT45]